MLRHVAALVATGGVALTVAACGSGGSSHSAGAVLGGPVASGDPTTLLRQTFTSTHAVKSGLLRVSIVITPKGSSELTTPITLSLSGPFQSGGGSSAQSALTVSFSGLGKHGSLGVTTTATGAYVTIEGTSYQLPSKDFKKLQSSLGSSSGSSSAPGLSSFGIDPQKWVSDPHIVGTQTIDGVLTEHLHAKVNVRAFVLSLNQVLAKESSTLKSAGSAASKVPTHISTAEASKIAAELQNPTVDVWTGKRDSTLRRLTVDATLPVKGSLSSELGGLTSAGLRFSIDYSELGTPQTITAPANPKSFSQLEAKLQSLGASLDGIGSTASSGSASGQASKYETCIEKADGQVAKMQKCSTLLQNAG